MLHTEELGVMAGILVPLAFFAMIFGIVYLSKRERMAMIERGMDPRQNNISWMQPRPMQNYLGVGLLMMGAGFGLFLAYVLDSFVLIQKTNSDNPAIYFSLITFFGGLGLLISHLIEKKEATKEKRNNG